MLTVISGAVIAIITAGPSYLALRRAKGAAHEEGTATREAVVGAVDGAVAVLTARVDELHHDVRRLEEWQVSHTAEHMALYLRDSGR